MIIIVKNFSHINIYRKFLLLQHVLHRVKESKEALLHNF